MKWDSEDSLKKFSQHFGIEKLTDTGVATILHVSPSSTLYNPDGDTLPLPTCVIVIT